MLNSNCMAAGHLVRWLLLGCSVFDACHLACRNHVLEGYDYRVGTLIAYWEASFIRLLLLEESCVGLTLVATR